MKPNQEFRQESSDRGAGIAARLHSTAALSTTPVKVTLDSGNMAVYLVQPQHMPREEIGESLRWPREFGEQIAHEKDGQWYLPGGWTAVSDQRACQLLDAVEFAQVHHGVEDGASRKRPRP